MRNCIINKFLCRNLRIATFWWFWRVSNWLCVHIPWNKLCTSTCLLLHWKRINILPLLCDDQSDYWSFQLPITSYLTNFIVLIFSLAEVVHFWLLCCRDSKFVNLILTNFMFEIYCRKMIWYFGLEYVFSSHIFWALQRLTCC